MYITGLMKTKSEFDCESLGGSFGRREERLKCERAVRWVRRQSGNVGRVAW